MSHADARATLAAWLDRPESREIERTLRRLEGLPAALGALDAAGETAESVEAVLTLKARATGLVGIERWLLIRRSLDAVDALDQAPLPRECRDLTAAELATLTTGEVSDASLLPHKARFREFCGMASGRRFSAGIFHAELGGLPWRWLLKVRQGDRVAAWLFLARRMRGRSPAIVPHVTSRRPAPHFTEPAVTRAYALFAETLLLQPQLLGLVAASWLRSPDTHRASPALACVNDPIRRHGGFVTTIGPAPPDCGVLARSETRRRLFESGEFTPTIGMTLWPRDAMLAWHRTLHPADSLM